MTIIASLTLVVPMSSDDEFSQNRVVGDFEFLHLPRVGDFVSIPICFTLNQLKVVGIAHGAREYPRANNHSLPSENLREPRVSIWAEESDDD